MIPFAEAPNHHACNKAEDTLSSWLEQKRIATLLIDSMFKKVLQQRSWYGLIVLGYSVH
jgi:hypothetical protein